MKLLVVSDSHGNTVLLQRIVDREKPYDCLVHCGDGVNDLIHVSLPADAAVITVAGNIDRARGIRGEIREFITVGERRVMVTHGDHQGAHHNYDGLIDEGTRYRCDLVLFGHTHLPYRSSGNPLLFNPGAAQRGLYGIVIFNGKMVCAHRRCVLDG